MKLAFYIGERSINPDAETWDRLICMWTQSKYSHVELLFSDGRCFAASPRDGGTRWKTIDFKPNRWDFLDWPGEVDEEYLAKWCDGQAGKKYDYWCLFFTHFLKFIDFQDPSRWMCSELAATTLQWPKPHTYDPGMVYRHILEVSELSRRIQS